VEGVTKPPPGGFSLSGLAEANIPHIPSVVFVVGVTEQLGMPSMARCNHRDQPKSPSNFPFQTINKLDPLHDAHFSIL
jgi:hypothetical protein